MIINYTKLGVFDHFLVKFKSLPFVENSSVDEQMCATKARHNLKVDKLDKPYKYG